MKRLLITLFIFLFLIGCETGENTDPQGNVINGHKIGIPNVILEQNSIRAALPTAYIIFGDEKYAPFNPYYRNEWHSKFVKTLFDLGLMAKWSDEFDCDSFAMLKAAVGQTLFAVHVFYESKTRQAVAVGEFWYLINGDKNKAHAINVVIEMHNNAPIARFVDIYTGKYVELTPVEVKSAFFIRF